MSTPAAHAPRISRRTIRALAVAVVTVGVLWALSGVAGAFHGQQTSRTAGDDRVETAAEVARAAHPDGAANAVIAPAGDFPDALAAAPLTRNPDGPLLLTAGDELSEPTRRALADLGVETATIVGGTAAVSEDVANELDDEVETVERVAGPNRFATAVAVADQVERPADRSIGHLGGPGARRTAFLVNGRRFPDALAASSPAASAANPFPILLTEQDELPDVTARALDDLDIGRVFVVGGTNAVSDDVVDQLSGEPLFVTADRLAGPNRVATAAAVAGRARQLTDGGADAGFGYDGSQALLTRGDDFADALAAGPLGGLRHAPVLLTPEANRLGDATAAWLAAECPVLDEIRAVGGAAAVADDVLAEAADCHEGRPHADYVVAPQEPLEGQPGDALQLRMSPTTNPKFTGSVDIALFPCGAVHTAGSPVRFTDEAGDGTADELGATDTGHATITSFEGRATDTRVLRDVGPVGDAAMRFRVDSDAPDCTVPVAFDDANGDGELQVDANGLPLEFWGWGHLSWSEG